jgi:uncharacterized protein (TIGR00255 family)
MTGSGAAVATTESGTTTVELRSVNGRTLGVKTRLATELQGLEAAVEGHVRRRLKRGTVFVSIAVASPSGGTDTVVDRAAAERVAAELRALHHHLNLAGDVDLRTLLSMPGVLVGSRARSSAGWSDAMATVFDAALDDLVRNRVTEGEGCAAAMRRQMDVFAELLTQVRARGPRLVADLRTRLLQRVNEFLAGRARALEEQDVLREVAMLADRSDTAEELDRLDLHVARFREILDAGGEVGRSLEFLLQEILRETNTLGAKSPDAEIAHAVVAMKTAVERLKEQGANLE